MTLFSIPLSDRRRTYVRLIGAIRNVLNSALADEESARGLTRADIGRILGKNKSVISRAFAGTSNMTLETLADLAYALNRTIKIELPQRSIVPQANDIRFFINPSATVSQPQQINISFEDILGAPRNVLAPALSASPESDVRALVNA